MLDRRPWPFDGLSMFQYGGIYIDCPWKTELYSAKGYEKAPEAHYDTMSFEELKALPVGNLASSDCLLFHWTTSTHVDQAIDLMRSWGFEYKSFICWRKRKPSGKQHIGPGYIVRSECELCLIGTIGRPVLNKKIAAKTRNFQETVVEALPPSIDAPVREHSRKPDLFRQLMEDYLPDSYFVCELFAREPWERGDVWGNEVNKFSGEQS